MKPIGVIVAVDREAREILAEPRFEWTQSGENAWDSRSMPLFLEVSGVGKAFASYSYARLAQKCELVIGLGTSGGMSDEAVGSLWIVGEFVEHDMCGPGVSAVSGITPFEGMNSPVIQSCAGETLSRALGALVAAGLDVRKGKSISGDAFIADPRIAGERRDFYEANLVDMECAACAKLAVFRAHKPYLALRYVTDNANHDSHVDWDVRVDAASGVLNAALRAICEVFI